MTHFVDLDGTLIRHHGDLVAQLSQEPELLPGVREKLYEWIYNDDIIIITTGRPESARRKTIEQLESLNISYHQLIMNLGRGPRCIYNDTKPDGTITAFSVPLERNRGFNDRN